MLSETDFAAAVNCAYDVRFKYASWLDRGALKFDPFSVIRQEPTRIYAYTYKEFMRRFGYTAADLAATPDGLTYCRKRNGTRQYIVAYDDTRLPERVRFTVAHELGHVFLEHDEENDENDALANCFARNLLSPALYAQHYALREYRYPDVFGVSKAAAYMAQRHYAEDLAMVSQETRRKFNTVFRGRYYAVDIDKGRTEAV